MDIKIFTQMLNDKSFNNYKKLKYKYPENFEDFLKNYKELYCEKLPLYDFFGENIVFAPNIAAINQNTIKLLLQSQSEDYSVNSAEEEIISTCSIENINFRRDSVRNILKGLAPKDEQENRILGIKQGFEFISDINNKITEENIYKLYMMTVGNFLEDEDKLQNGNFYRHDRVYVVSDRLEHSGLDYKKIPEYMKNLVSFANKKDQINDLIKAAIIHFYIVFIHPYFDGNGRMARLIHLWFLIQKGYQSALFISFSAQIEKSRKNYYNAYTFIEENRKISGETDVTPFILYLINNVYNKMEEKTLSIDTLDLYRQAVKNGQVTEKETKLWKFVLSYYGLGEFSTKQLEKDFGDAAYATIRSFVLKFKELGLLASTKYGTRVKYRVIQNFDC